MAEPLTISNGRGLKLAALLYRPDGPGPFPAVINLPGFTGYKEQEHRVALAEDLAQVGILSITFDPSGFGESEGSIAQDYRLSHYKDDLESMYHALTALPEVDSSRIGINGHSIGGLLAIIWSAEHPEIQAVCAISAPTEMLAVHGYREVFPQWKEAGWLHKESEKFGTLAIPYAYVEDASAYRGLTTAPLLQSPLLVIAGERDTTVLAANTRELFEAAPEPKEFVLLPEVAHDYRKDPALVQQVNEVIIPFFRRHLK